ncbi:MAG TPA: AI-2E family transporter [Trebonia sp.]|jgi:predicted PurR-regulated permease PerM|nr:AI-2E family transporter [Trebonia sp.]
MVWRGAGSTRPGWLAWPRATAGGSRAPGEGGAAGEGGAPGTLPLPEGASIEDTVSPESRGDVPRWLRTGAAWGWRLLLLAVIVYILARIAGVLYIVVVPCAASLLLTALLHPLEARLRRRGLPALASTWCTLLLAVVVLAGATALATARVQAEYPALVAQWRHTTGQIQSWLAGPPFHLKTGNLGTASGGIVKYLGQHQSIVEGTVLTGGRIAAEALAGAVLFLFVTFFLLKDGRQIWLFLIHRMRPANRVRVDRAGQAAWTSVEYYVRGTVAVAAIHAVVMGVTLTIMSAPLAVPIALFMFLAAFIPLVGVLIAGAVAVVVTLAAKGVVAALIVLGVLVLMNQLEGHLLQPQIVGKMVHLHPLAVILVLAVGGVVAGIAGAVVAVPITAALARFIPALRQSAEVPPDPPVPIGEPPGPPAPDAEPPGPPGQEGP